MRIRHSLSLACAGLLAFAVLLVYFQQNRAIQRDNLTALQHANSEFFLWLDAWDAAHALADEQLLARGIELATERRERMRQLLATDPEAALEASIGFAAYEKLPPELQ